MRTSIPIAGRPDPRRREPLWDRVDRNKVRLAAYVALFVGAAVVSLDLLFVSLIGAVIGMMWWVSLQNAMNPAGNTRLLAVAPELLLGASIVFGVLALGWAIFMIMRSEKWLLRRFGAAFVPKGELLDTKMALKDMAIAAGGDVAPVLYLLDTPNVNAFVFAARRRRAVIGVTKGFVTRLTLAEQRAAFANLVSRLVSGDTIVDTGVTALMWPLHAWQERDFERQDARMWHSFGAPKRSDEAAEDAEPTAVAILMFVFGVALAILSAVLGAGHRIRQLHSAEKADAEGMLLLKDPGSMLTALERCVRLNNSVPGAGAAFGGLFYCWTGDSTDDESDPEWRRVARLREVLGVEGAVFEEPAVDDGADLVAPVAPRVS